MPHLSISGLCKAFGKKKLLDGPDLAVERGECLVVFGGSGSRKTPFLRPFAGPLGPDAGAGLVDGLDRAVERGECLVVFGGSGSGKTTLLRHIAGLLEPDAGTVLIDGQRAGDVSA